MNLIFRMFWLILTTRRVAGASLFDPSHIRLRVLPNDLDIQMHMNNGRFLSIMDLGRIAYMIQIGFWPILRARGWFPLVGAMRMDYRRPLLPLRRYTLETRMLGWDDRWIYMEQQFHCGGKIAARGLVKAMLRQKSGLVTPAEAMHALGIDVESPRLSDEVRAFLN